MGRNQELRGLRHSISEQGAMVKLLTLENREFKTILF